MRIGKTQYYFGGSSGVIYFDESKLTKNSYSPQVIITDFKIQNTTVKVGGSAQQFLENTITYTKKQRRYLSEHLEIMNILSQLKSQNMSPWTTTMKQKS